MRNKHFVLIVHNAAGFKIKILTVTRMDKLRKKKS